VDAKLIEELLEKIKKETTLAEFPLADILTKSELTQKLTAAMITTIIKHTKGRGPEEELLWVHEMIVTAMIIGYRLHELEYEMKVN
jgi:hypothetical protein